MGLGDNWLELKQDEDTRAGSKEDQAESVQSRWLIRIIAASMCSNKLPYPAMTQLPIHFRQLIITNGLAGCDYSERNHFPGKNNQNCNTI